MQIQDKHKINPDVAIAPSTCYDQCLSDVYNEDCIEVMKRYPDNYFDLAVVDPPYGLDLANMNMGAGKSKKASKIQNRKWKPKDWDKDLCINAIAGKLHIMLLGDTKQNPTPEMSDTGGFNPDNCIVDFPNINADGGDW